MKKICKCHKNTKGFTLIELLVVMAIIVVFIPIVLAAFYTINKSHSQVVVLNDAEKFATLNLDACRNIIANGKSYILQSSAPAPTGYKSLYFSSGVLYYGSSQAFDYDQYKLSNGDNKWSVSGTFVPNGLAIDITINVYDNATGKLVYTLTDTYYNPNIDKSTEIVNNGGVAPTVIAVEPMVLPVASP